MRVGCAEAVRTAVLEQVYATLDWAAGVLARVLGRGDDPGSLARPMVGVALLGGLAADALGAVAAGARATGLVAVTLTICGSGALWLVVGRLGSGGGAGGGTRSLGAAVMEDWLRRLQAVFCVVLVIVVSLALAGAVVVSVSLIVRNLAETVRVAGVLLAISYALMDRDAGAPAWLADRAGGADRAAWGGSE